MDLPAGAKVSVRNLAKDLGISEGTAYKAIKYAEEMNLVKTKSRAGTIRLPQDIFSDVKPVTLASEIGRLGLVVLTGAEYADVPIGSILLGDGSLEQFKTSILSAGPNALCLVGDRPDLLFCAAYHGVNMIVTCNTQPGEALLAAANEHGACVLSSVQDSYTVLNFLRSETKKSYQATNSDRADKWMRIPPYLYYNDIVADWHNSYRSLFSLGSKCAVVDDDLHICGTIDAAKVLASSPSVKISSLYASDSKAFSADEATPMHEIAQHMISEETSTAYITRNNALCGVITANDVLRYYQYNPSASRNQAENFVILESLSSDSRRSVYSVHIEDAGKDLSKTLFNLLAEAARRYCDEQFGTGCTFTSGSFYTLASPAPGELMLSCALRQSIPSGFILEVEIYDEISSYARCIAMVSAGGAEI